MGRRHNVKLTGTEWVTYRRLISFARPYTRRLILGVFFGMIFGGSMGAMLYWLMKTFDTLFSPDRMSLLQTLLVAAVLPLVMIVRGVGDYFSTYLVEWVGSHVVMDLRTKAFVHLQDLSVGFYNSTKTGELISRTINDTSMVDRAVSTVLGDLAKQPTTLISAVSFLLWLNWRLALLSLVVFPVCIMPVAIFGKRVRRYAREGQEKVADLMSILQETITGVRIVKAFGMEGYEKERFDARCKAVFRRSVNVSRAKAAMEPILVFISGVGLSLILIYANWTHMTSAAFMSFAVAMVAMYEPVKKLSKIHLSVQQSSAAADRIFELLDTPVQVQEAPGAHVFHEPLRSITFENVGFRYEKDPVLEDIDLVVPAGQCVALVGSSGSGKSTLVSLLPRFYDVSEGRLLVNDHDVRSLTLASLRRQIGIVTQETVLFNDTVAHNICYGQTDAAPEAIREAARRAHAHDFIEALPLGYETIIGERGVRLSGGQRQRLAIARAILRNPPILVLDEATSALDTESERLVQAALDELMTGRTVFAIAHRLSTIQHADRILVLDGGRIVEQGTHAELLASSGVYRRLHDIQFQNPAASSAT